MKAGIKRLINALVSLMGSNYVGRYLFSQIAYNTMDQIQTIEHQGLNLSFVIPNAINKFRADTFSTKEPETLKWIDAVPSGSVVWDIGANVGIYSCYAAKKRNCKVYAFEPSIFTLELLARNIYINNLTEQVIIIPLPLSESLTVSKFNMSSTEWGEALSTFSKPYGYDGLPLHKKFEFSTIGLSMNEAVKLLRIPKPDYIKLDVDGLEHLILRGGDSILQNVQSVLVEINDNFQQQSDDSAHYLKEAGLQLMEKRRWEDFDNTDYESTYNQIWHRVGNRDDR